MKHILLFIVCFCMLSVVVFAQSDFERKQQYLGASVGMLVSSGGIEMGGLDIGIESGLSLGLQYINYFKRWERTHIGASVHLGYAMLTSEEVEYEYVYNGQQYSDIIGSGDASTMNIGLGLNVKHELLERVDLLADVGVAYYINDLSGESSGGAGFVRSDDEEVEASDNTLGFFISGGANYLITSSLALGVRVSYVMNNYDKDDVTVDMGGVNILATLGYMF